MKKSLLIVVTIFVSVLTSNAQLKVASNGYTSFVSSSTPLSPISVGYAGNSNYEVSIFAEDRYGVYCQTASTDNGKRYGGYFNSTVNGVSGFSIGLYGEALSYNTTYSSGRAYGLYGAAGNATSGYNYGVFGRLGGSQNGSGVFGTSFYEDDGVNTNGRYAGYFHGDVKITDDLYVLGSISGTMLSPGRSNTGADIEQQTAYSPRSAQSTLLTSKVAALELMSFVSTGREDSSTQRQEGDSIAAERTVSAFERQDAGRVHYALSVEQLEEMFPELVYEQKDGSKAVNYVEMIPILVQCINELSGKVAELQGKGNTDSISPQSRSRRPISLDGKVIGNK